MFDIGFTELMVVAVVALVVIGPERLPTVARTVGALLGRLNRYVSDVKGEVEREMRMEDMKKLRAEVEMQAASIEQQVVSDLEKTNAEVKAATAPVQEVTESLADVVQQTGNALSESNTQVGTAVAESEASFDNSRKTELAAAAPSSDEPSVKSAVSQV